MQGKYKEAAPDRPRADRGNLDDVDVENCMQQNCMRRVAAVAGWHAACAGNNARRMHISYKGRPSSIVRSGCSGSTLGRRLGKVNKPELVEAYPGLTSCHQPLLMQSIENPEPA